MYNFNLQDAYRLVDSVGGFLVLTNYAKKYELQSIFETIPLEDRLDRLHAQMSNYLQFIQNLE
jgi:hypothetical protein